MTASVLKIHPAKPLVQLQRFAEEIVTALRTVTAG